MTRTIRIGTRESELAVWQASRVKEKLAASGISSKLCLLKSQGDLDLSSPLHLMGGQGVFTHSLNLALLENRIDIAVHSMKDLPTQLPGEIQQCCVLSRGPARDILVVRTNSDFLSIEGYPAVIATGSLRRRAQWLAHYPVHQMVELRGNVNTRLAKLSASDWDGAIFAQAGLVRIGLQPSDSIVLNWMLPAPAQGAISVVCRKEDEEVFSMCRRFNDEMTEYCTKIERDFMRTLEGGCASPIGALATISQHSLHFTGNLTAPDGSSSVSIRKTVSLTDAASLGTQAAKELLRKGGAQIMDAIRKSEE